MTSAVVKIKAEVEEKLRSAQDPVHVDAKYWPEIGQSEKFKSDQYIARDVDSKMAMYSSQTGYLSQQGMLKSSPTPDASVSPCPDPRAQPYPTTYYNSINGFSQPPANNMTSHPMHDAYSPSAMHGMTSYSYEHYSNMDYLLSARKFDRYSSTSPSNHNPFMTSANGLMMSSNMAAHPGFAMTSHGHYDAPYPSQPREEVTSQEY